MRRGRAVGTVEPAAQSTVNMDGLGCFRGVEATGCETAGLSKVNTMLENVKCSKDGT